MNSSATAAVIGLVLGAGFLVAALASTLSRVTLSVFNPWLLRQVRYREQPRAFVALVLFYWLFGLAGVGTGIAAMFGGLRL
jgi:hypothetical protein